jgi:quercetin dioxygenase-like cupin family protein
MLKLISIIPLKVLVMIIIGLFINGKIVLAQESHQFNRSILLEKNIVLPNNAVNTKVIRVIFPPAFKTPWHTHEGPGPRYVVKGSLKVIEGGKANTYSSGDVFWESGDLMSVENINETPAELIIFELVPAK